MTQGAISRQIRQLEEYLGKAMFTRANRSINLTPTGLQYYQAVSQSLLDIAQITGEVKKWQGEQRSRLRRQMQWQPCGCCLRLLNFKMNMMTSI
ncbi:LysR family transcriptional regulator [Vibrio alginolyticus]|uniref:LysR family transcriptional regulator n=1 Tax=Vibrio alginolyticus TaxID=663 RepID=UPI001E5383D4|nr:LysR family transcriptional regulator [Vibrio alginolyticus]